MQSKKIDGVDVVFDSNWIEEVESLKHFHYYHNQATLVDRHVNKSDKLLEIGVGSKFLSDYLRRRDWLVTTLDIDDNKKPDICSDAYDFPYEDYDFSTVLAFEIFEHIPFLTFKKVIERISKSKVSNIIFSVPWCEKQVINASLKIPKLKEISFYLAMPLNVIECRTHFWEMAKVSKQVPGGELVSVDDVLMAFTDNDFDVQILNKVNNIQFMSAVRRNVNKD